MENYSNDIIAAGKATVNPGNVRIITPISRSIAHPRIRSRQPFLPCAQLGEERRAGGGRGRASRTRRFVKNINKRRKAKIKIVNINLIQEFRS